MSSGADGRPLAALANARALERELRWLAEVVQTRLALHFGQPCAHRRVDELAPPPADDPAAPYVELLRRHRLDWAERLVLALALAPHVQPQLLDGLFVRNPNTDRGFSEFGGTKGRVHAGFLPTGETAAFLVAGEQLDARFALRRLFEPDHAFHRHGMLRLHPPGGDGEPFLAGSLQLAEEYVERLTGGGIHHPDYSAGFPARRIGTALEWSDLVLADESMDEIETILGWSRHGPTLLERWGLARTLKPGYRSLFHGPPGTGKTLTATLIGKAVGAEVYRVDLSMVVSKYIGETEKNLALVFDQAATRNWILLFDEADALFGRRTATSSANDRYANQEVAYLLQRVEDHPGQVILATNLKGNLDDAFARRFQSLVHFPMPDAEQRLRLWRGLLAPPLRIEPGLDLPALADAHELAGGAIANVVRHAAIRTLVAGRQVIGRGELQQGIARELRKEGRTP